METRFSPVDRLLPTWICLTGCVLAARLLAEGGNDPNCAPDHVLIKFKAEIALQLAAAPATNILQTLLSNLGLAPGAELNEPAVNQLLHSKGADGPSETTSPNFDRFVYLRLPPGLTVQECIA